MTSKMSKRVKICVGEFDIHKNVCIDKVYWFT